MSLPENSHFSPPALFRQERGSEPQGALPKKQDLAKAVLRQLEKDFALQGMSVVLPESVPPYGKLLELLAEHLHSAEIDRGDKLARLLYQIDLDERKVRKLLADAAPEHTLRALAHEMVHRCCAKVVMRAKFS